jgi:hypothetical protein
MHGTRFGFDRARKMSSARRVVQLFASPAVPLIFGRKIAKAAWARPDMRGHLLPALPYLAFFIHAWALGEARGTLRALMHRDAGVGP